MINKCKYCNHLKELHYKEGEQRYIKFICGNRFGISDFSPVIPELDFCSRFEEKEQPAVKIGDEVIVDGVKGIVVREPYQIGNPDNPLFLVLVWYGCYMGDAQLRDVQLTGKKYPWMDVVLEELKDKKEEEG